MIFRTRRFEIEIEWGWPWCRITRIFRPRAKRPAPGQYERDPSQGCAFAGPQRGDCENAVGFPGISIPDQHDGPDDTVDVYGKPNGWCWSCWKSHRIERMHAQLHAAGLREEGFPTPQEEFADYAAHRNAMDQSLTL